MTGSRQTPATRATARAVQALTPGSIPGVARRRPRSLARLIRSFSPSGPRATKSEFALSYIEETLPAGDRYRAAPPSPPPPALYEAMEIIAAVIIGSAFGHALDLLYDRF